MTLAQLLTRVNHIGRDYTGRIWDPTAVKSYINQGYNEFVRETHCLRTNDKITITPNIDIYSLPSDVLQLYRIEWNKRIVKATTEWQMDNIFGAGWRVSTGTNIRYVMQDNQGEGTIRIYPRLSSSDNIGTLVEVIGTDSNDYFCHENHTSTDDDKPITGVNYPLYWTATGGTGDGSVWASGTAYTEYFYLYVDYAYVPTDLSADGDEPDLLARDHHALAEYAIYMMQSQEVQSKKKPITARSHLNSFYNTLGQAKMRTVAPFAARESQLISTVPAFEGNRRGWRAI